MKGTITRKIGLSLTFALAVMVILIVTSILIWIVAWAFGLFEAQTRPNGPTFLFVIMIACVVVGTIVAFTLSGFGLKPTRKIIDAMEQLATGNLDARLMIKHPREYRELSNSFNTMAKELKSIEVLRNDFVNNFSHEFKTPIVSIKGFAEELLKDDLSDHERQEYLEIIVKESDRLARLATDVLDLSKVETQAMLPTVETFDLTEQIRRCVLMLEARWEEKQLVLTIDMEEVSLCGDESLLSQVWLNILDNAIKYTPSKGHIDVSLHQRGNDVVVTIKDNGLGMNNTVQGHAFDKFYQGDTSHTSPGNGIGLTMAKQIIALHKGTISLESMLEEGTQVTVALPRI